jgi:hypothetical protein
MAEWGAWFGALGASPVDGGNPFGPSRTVNPEVLTGRGSGRHGPFRTDHAARRAHLFLEPDSQVMSAPGRSPDPDHTSIGRPRPVDPRSEGPCPPRRR